MRRAAVLGMAWLVLVGIGFAQAAPAKPGPEHKKMDFFAGSWTLDGDVRPGPMGPGGKMVENRKCEWLEGGFYVVCHSDYKGPMGNGAGLSVMGYSAADKAYTYREFNSDGEFLDSKGMIEGDAWTWTSEDKIGAMTIRGKFTMTVTSPNSYAFSFDMSQDGTKWITVMDGKATRK